MAIQAGLDFDHNPERTDHDFHCPQQHARCLLPHRFRDRQSICVGMYGSHFVVLSRILLSLVWYAVQAWIGGECVYVSLQAIWPTLEERMPNYMSAGAGMTTTQSVAYVVFSVISFPLIWIRSHKLQKFFYVSVTIVLVFEVSLLIWALATMGDAGFGDTLSSKPLTQDTSVGWTILYGIISTIGGISAGILNQNDYARFSRRPLKCYSRPDNQRCYIRNPQLRDRHPRHSSNPTTLW